MEPDETRRSTIPVAELDSAEYHRLMDVFESSYWSSELVNGAIPICHEGCALRLWLVVKSPQFGYLWRDRRAEHAGIEPLRLAEGQMATFLSWYDEWLQQCPAAVKL